MLDVVLMVDDVQITKLWGNVMTLKKPIISIMLSSLMGIYALSACAENAPPKTPQTPIETSTIAKPASTTATTNPKKAALPTIQHPDFVAIQTLSDDIVLDIKYATSDNFLKQQVYECPACFLRHDAAQALVKANAELMKKGYRIKVFDCYRPLAVQRKMWKILPNTPYVANPAKGSKHNRGAAVDLTLVTLDGKELDMGTPFDFFGKKAHHAYKNLPKQVLENRTLLKNTMDKYNFRSISSEWWHYEYRPLQTAKVENFTWDCPKTSK